MFVCGPQSSFLKAVQDKIYLLSRSSNSIALGAVEKARTGAFLDTAIRTGNYFCVPVLVVVQIFCNMCFTFPI